MSRSRFRTDGLKKHQADVAVWVRRRLVDRKAVFRNGNRRVRQSGIVLADGVGLGKTWEALAASALLLVERSKRTKAGKKQTRTRRQAAKILVLCPPGLVSKWTREIRDPDGFRKQLELWTKQQPNRRGFVLDTLEQPYEISRAQDLDELPKPKTKRRHIVLTEGVYVCNWNVVQRQQGSGRSRLNTLRLQKWDVLIVDEAHHREARKALKVVLHGCDVRAIVLLTATPFQLDPKELHPLLATLLETRHGDHKIMSRPPVVSFVKSLERFFETGNPPARADKTNAECHLRQVIVRNQVRNSGRRFFIINQEGLAQELDPPPDRRSESELQKALPLLIQPDTAFEAWYFRRRLQLAGAEGAERTFVPTRLRQALSTKVEAKNSSGVCPPCSPRTDALLRWARQQIEDDLRLFMQDGLPRKILVFTSFLKAASELSRALDEVTNHAWRAIRGSSAWKDMVRHAPRNIDLIRRKVEGSLSGPKSALHYEHLPARMQVPIDNILHLVGTLAAGESMFADFCGHRHFRDMVVEDLLHRIGVLAAISADEGQEHWQRRLHRYEIKRLKAAIRAQQSGNLASTYTGKDDRGEREASGEAFRSPLGPWVLIASNVGSEGIDLQTLSAHLVHFDIEWNPARMEQREGRIDRVGRRLKEPVNVYYLLVRRTYDERMLFQLVSRQRWHSVLLGRPAARLARDQKGVQEARFLDVKPTQDWTLNLRPDQR
jgi:hypothetical protein